MNELSYRINNLEDRLGDVEYDIASVKYINTYTINAKLKEENAILKDLIDSYKKLCELNEE